MEQVRVKFKILGVLKDDYGHAKLKLCAVYKGEESSPEKESLSNSIPSGNVELTSHPAAIEFFEKLAGKYVYADFTEATGS